MGKFLWYLQKSQHVVTSDSEIIENIHSNHITQCHKEVCAIPRSARIKTEHDLCRCSENVRLTGTKSIGNGKSRHKTSNLMNKSNQNHKCFPHKSTKTGQMARYIK